jgi:nucleoside-diphosphate-sugar epimerase
VTRVLVTGATGFVGRHLCAALAARGVGVRAAVRGRPEVPVPGAAEVVEVGDIGPATAWGAALDGVDAVIHLAARVHVMSDDSADPLSEYRRVNTAGTERLARQAAAAGVRRMVLASSVKVNGEETAPGAAFGASDVPAPADPYGVSKHEAEEALFSVAGIEGVVVRPPLVYGPGVRANFLALVRAVDRGVPLPLGRISNRRSLVYAGNLADALALCAAHPAAAGRTYLVSDGEPLSTPGLVRALARALGRPARLLPVPPAALRAAGALAGRRAAVARLCGSLVVDDAPLRAELGWAPPLGVDAGLAETVRAYREGR